MSGEAYGEAFYDLADQSIAAARIITKMVMAAVPVASVLDIGCARGAWLAAWREAGCDDVMGVDGAAAARGELLIPRSLFLERDLRAPLAFGRRFDLVQCLEVAEHLPKERAYSMVTDLTAHGDVVLFSAAPPGQGGANHINEQPYEYWRALFAEHDFVAVDCLRPQLATVKSVPYWYRFNLVLYVAKARFRSLNASAQDRRVPAGVPIPDVAPVLFKLRKSILRLLPPAVVTRLAFLAGS